MDNFGPHTTPDSTIEDGEVVDYRDLKAWIEEQETSSHPAPLTEVQRRAISDLKASLRQKASWPAPDMSDDNTDWISLLFRYLAAHQAEGATATFEDEAASQNRWACVCFFQATSDSVLLPFPRPCDEPVGFSRKKDAKQYAAKCCVQWLMSAELMPSDRVNVVFPKMVSRTAPPKPRPATKVENNNGAAPPLPAIKATSPSASASNNASMDMDDEDIAHSTRVAEMCQRLGFVVPVYRMTPAAEVTYELVVGDLELDPNMFFDCCADFGVDSASIPESVCRQKCIYGRFFAKETVAEELLVYLLQVEAKRSAIAEALLNDAAEDLD
ncbi:hypothetical protein B0H63DRAFT_400444 [Podospora didyma]|uniref:DRBM domain-containing protein n=1 Tax=Podospora didyma TaxID=330526 RepID=A0AAE0KER7_9PEZI|nr:hypothetical protein B0H63DRAFT_400444 [Podospora didyma]